jgi:hypothetical protein
LSAGTPLSKNFGVNVHQIKKREAVNILKPIIDHTNNGVNYFTIKLLIINNLLRSSGWNTNSILGSCVAGFKGSIIAMIIFEKIYKIVDFFNTIREISSPILQNIV